MKIKESTLSTLKVQYATSSINPTTIEAERSSALEYAALRGECDPDTLTLESIQYEGVIDFGEGIQVDLAEHNFVFYSWTIEGEPR